MAEVLAKVIRVDVSERLEAGERQKQMARAVGGLTEARQQCRKLLARERVPQRVRLSEAVKLLDEANVLLMQAVVLDGQHLNR